MLAQTLLHHFGGLAGVERGEVEFRGHRVQIFDHPALVLAKRFEEVLAQRQMHPGFPIAHALAFEHARDQRVDANLEVGDQIRNQGESEQRARPIRVGAHHAIAREGGIGVAVGDYHQSGLKRRDDLVFEPVGKIGGIEQAVGRGVEAMAGFGLVDGFLQQPRARPSRADDAVTLDLEPRLKLLDLGRAADAVGAFDYDQAALKLA